jgi:hypothetical protein
MAKTISFKQMGDYRALVEYLRKQGGGACLNSLVEDGPNNVTDFAGLLQSFRRSDRTSTVYGVTSTISNPSSSTIEWQGNTKVANGKIANKENSYYRPLKPGSGGFCQHRLTLSGRSTLVEHNGMEVCLRCHMVTKPAAPKKFSWQSVKDYFKAWYRRNIIDDYENLWG